MKTETTKVLILGGGFAGVIAALRLAGKTRKKSVQITLVSVQEQLIERTRMHQLAVGQSLKTHSIPDFLRNTGITFVRGRVIQLLPDQKLVIVEKGEATETLEYDKLVYALGSFADLSAIPGASENAYTLDWSSAQKVRTLLPEMAQRNGHVVVIGAGLTGLELVTELAETFPHLQVSLLCGGTLGADFSTRATNHVHRVLHRLSVSLHEHCKVTQITPTEIHCADGQTIPADLCFVCGGFAVSPLAKAAGIKVNERGQILVNAHLQSVSHRDIYGAGDASVLAENVMNLRMACATAMPMACYVADRLAAEINGDIVQPFRFGFAVRCVSLGRSDAILQFVDPTDRPKPGVLTGRLAVWAKEAILQFVIGSIRLTRLFPNAYQWPRSISARTIEETAEWQFVVNRQ